MDILSRSWSWPMDTPQTIEISNELLPQLYLVIAITFLLGVTVIVFCIFYLRRLYAKEFEIQRIKGEQKQLLLEANLEAEEKERARIAGDLHDEVGATLSTIKLYISHLEENPDASSLSNLPKVTKMIDETIQSVRHISHNLTPSNLHQFGLISAIENLCEKVNGSKGIEVKYEYQDHFTCRKEHELHIYRIIHELLNNTLKHAEATEIRIKLESADGQMIMEYRDNGKGIPMGNNGEPTGLGLQNIQSRAAIIGARIVQPNVSSGFQMKIIR